MEKIENKVKMKCPHCGEEFESNPKGNAFDFYALREENEQARSGDEYVVYIRATEQDSHGLYTGDDMERTLRDRIAEAEKEIDRLKQEETYKKAVSESIIPAYKQFRSWSIEFHEASLEAKKIIVSQLFSKVSVNRNYEINYELNFTYIQFCEDWIGKTLLENDA